MTNQKHDQQQKTEFEVISTSQRQEYAGHDLTTAIITSDPYTHEGAMAIEAKRQRLEIRLRRIDAEFTQSELTALTEHQAEEYDRYIAYMEYKREAVKHSEIRTHYLAEHFNQEIPIFESRLRQYTEAFHVRAGQATMGI